ncbi:hypothetical protein [Sinomicrobium pectinilyticum]|nr:hypothetical protein [Sinomicrobium pectinilyticum]
MTEQTYRNEKQAGVKIIQQKGSESTGKLFLNEKHENNSKNRG